MTDIHFDTRKEAAILKNVFMLPLLLVLTETKPDVFCKIAVLKDF